MILESCQLLSTACKTDGAIIDAYESAKIPWGSQLYAVTHANHPCAKWVRESKHNFVWLTIHLDSLLREYHARFPGKTHKCEKLLFDFAMISAQLAGCGFYTRSPEGRRVVSFGAAQFASKHTPFVYCGPDRYRISNHFADSVRDSYREYYTTDKMEGNRWTRHASLHLPDWMHGAHIHERVAVQSIRKVTPIEIQRNDNPAVKMPTRFGKPTN